jgi:4-diphosphocytidyl-2-C-methyl-D-erythritol kinase
MSHARALLGLPAPAKINLFLHVVGRRPNGYHELQSVFVPIDLCDTIDVVLAHDGRIIREGELSWPVEQDLAYRAAQLLREHARANGRTTAALEAGAHIGVNKQIPVGAGLGGGSSDAATTLIALNQLWGLSLSRSTLIRLGQTLGADVAFFLQRGGAAFVEGLGEVCTPISLPQRWYVVIFPDVSVPTAQIFSDPKLTRDHKKTTIAGFSAVLTAATSQATGASPWETFGCNDLEPVARRRYQSVDDAVTLLGSSGLARMSGSGSSVFCVCQSADEAARRLNQVRAVMPAAWSAWVVPGLQQLPLAQW